MLPKTFWLVTNYTCNNRCKFCYAAGACLNATKDNSSVMDFNYACSVMEEMVSSGANDCLLIGGEPTLYHNLTGLIEFGKKIGLKMTIVSNGRKLSNTQMVLDLKESGIDHITISIEASDAQLHNQITQSLSFKETMSGIINVKNAGISLSTNLTVSKFNYQEITKIAEKMNELGINKCHYNHSVPSLNPHEQSTDGSYTLTPKEYARVISQSYMDLERKGIIIYFVPNLPWCLIDPVAFEQMVKDRVIKPLNCQCQMYNGSGIVFEPNGNVLPCTHFIDAPLFNAMDEQGRFSYKGKLAEEWTNGLGKIFLDELWRYPAHACKSCKFWGACTGGCPLLWTYYNPEEFITGIA